MPHVAGNDIGAYCQSCSKDQEHTVLEVHDGVVYKVRCKTCRADHAYQRPHAPASKKKKAKAAPRKRAKKSAKEPTRPAWEVLLEGLDPQSARDYGVKELFAQDDFISHATFGLGVVTALFDGGKIEVVFREGVKKLVHDRG